MQNTKINWLAGKYLLLVTTLTVLVVAFTAIADLYDPYAFIELLSGSAPSDVCNRLFAARLLFWGLLVTEMIVVGRLIIFPFDSAELDAYRARGKEVMKMREFSHLTQRRLVMVACGFAVVTYFGSFHLAYLAERVCSSDRSGHYYYWLCGLPFARSVSFLCLLDLCLAAGRDEAGGER